MILPLLLAAWVLVSVPAGEADPLEAVKAADVALAKAVLDGDRQAFAALLEPEVIFLDAAAPGRDAAVAGWSRYFEEKRISLLQWKPDRGQVAASGDLAYTTGPFDFERTGPDGKVAHFAGRYLTLWQQSEGHWQVWADGSWLDPAAGTFTSQLGSLWPPAGAPDVAVAIERKPLRTARSQAGDLQLVVGEMTVKAGEKKAKSRYATVSEPDGKGGWRIVAEAAAPPVAE